MTKPKSKIVEANVSFESDPAIHVGKGSELFAPRNNGGVWAEACGESMITHHSTPASRAESAGDSRNDAELRVKSEETTNEKQE